MCAKRGLADYAALHAWSVSDRAGFWQAMLGELRVPFRRPPQQLLDVSQGVEAVSWLPGAQLNVA